MDFTQPVSGRQFAKMVGASEGAVRKAIKGNSILKGVTADKKIIPSIAAYEWGKEILKEFRTGEIDVKKKPSGPKPQLKPIIIKKEKTEPQTADEIIEGFMKEKLPSIPKDLDFEEEDFDIDEGKTSKSEAERVSAIMKAEILKIALKEKQGQLIPIDKIEKVLFSFGYEIRNTFEVIPNKIIDKIRACDDRASALRVLNESIHEALSIISDVQNRKI